MPDGSRQQNDQIFVQSLREITGPQSAACGILSVRDGMDNVQRLECGRDWRRIHLWGATHGLAFQPLNQMCERVNRERQTGVQPVMGEAVRGLPGADVWQASMPFRTGYPTQSARPRPRRSIESLLLWDKVACYFWDLDLEPAAKSSGGVV